MSSKSIKDLNELINKSFQELDDTIQTTHKLIGELREDNKKLNEYLGKNKNDKSDTQPS